MSRWRKLDGKSSSAAPRARRRAGCRAHPERAHEAREGEGAALHVAEELTAVDRDRLLVLAHAEVGRVEDRERAPAQVTRRRERPISREVCWKREGGEALQAVAVLGLERAQFRSRCSSATRFKRPWRPSFCALSQMASASFPRW